MISVIVPVYNAEKYLKCCIESILRQTYEIFELILVDDGSTDKSGEICDQYANIDCRIQVIHKVNGGSVSARYEGVRIAKGEYTVFVDADDWIEENELEYLFGFIDNQDIDMIEFGYIKEHNNISENRHSALCEGVYTQEIIWENINKCIYEEPFPVRTIDYCMWNKIIKTDLCKAVLCEIDPKIKIGEDAAFVFELIHRVENIRIIYRKLYHYRVNTQSIVHKKNEDIKWVPFENQIVFINNKYNIQKDDAYFKCMHIYESFFINPTYAIEKFVVPFLSSYNKIVLFGKGVISNNVMRLKEKCGLNIVDVIDSTDIYRIREIDYDVVFIAVLNSETIKKAIELLKKNDVAMNEIKYLTL